MEHGNSKAKKTGKKVFTAALEKLTNHKAKDWKKTLSGAMNEEQLFFALIVIVVFYFLYTLLQYLEGNRDEDAITTNCRCDKDHRSHYLSLVILCSILWGIFYFLLLIWSYSKACKKLCHQKKSDSKLQTDTFQQNSTVTHTGICDYIKKLGNKQGCVWLFCCCPFRLLTTVLEYIFCHTKIKLYEYHLWTQYYELYIIGITKNNDNFNLDCLRNLIEETLTRKRNQEVRNESPWELKSRTENKEPFDPQHKKTTNREPILQHQVEEPTPTSNTTNITHDLTVALPSNQTCSMQACFQFFIHLLLKITQVVAHLAVVVFLMFQMLDTYAFLCFFADNYCTTREEYKLHLHQTGITFGFYCSLMTSLLTTRMLSWIPFPISLDKTATGSQQSDEATHKIELSQEARPSKADHEDKPTPAVSAPIQISGQPKEGAFDCSPSESDHESDASQNFYSCIQTAS